ncbi:MAG: glycerol-3-phosphate 1-O-acyltransferase PlsY [Puniceicoccales bacterium]|jgi:glycerol-3-phosphate acyltransferase PlsY|nr:glycerol-3-phosphate 1-O-acyltransferase PlsY [Puniceicoccales bacterium]
MEWYFYVVTIFLSYIIGSLSFGAAIAKIKKVNIFSVGSCTSGATNVNRTIGKYAGYLVFVLDFSKGVIPSWVIVKFLFPENPLGTKLAMIALLAVLLGHSFSIFHNLRGGKGISSAMGGLLIIMPKTLPVGIFIWLVIFYATKIVSMASLCFSSSILLTSYLFLYSKEHILFALILNVIIFWRHRENIGRLIRGTEYKFTKKN